MGFISSTNRSIETATFCKASIYIEGLSKIRFWLMIARPIWNLLEITEENFWISCMFPAIRMLSTFCKGHSRYFPLYREK